MEISLKTKSELKQNNVPQGGRASVDNPQLVGGYKFLYKIRIFTYNYITSVSFYLNGGKVSRLPGLVNSGILYAAWISGTISGAITTNQSSVIIKDINIRNHTTAVE